MKQERKIMPVEEMPEQVQKIGFALGACLKEISNLNVFEGSHVIANMVIKLGAGLAAHDGIEACAHLDHAISQMIFAARVDMLSSEDMDRYQSTRSNLTGDEVRSGVSYDTPEGVAREVEQRKQPRNNN